MKKKLALWLPITLFFCFSVLFYGPLGIYLTNAQEMWFSLGDVLKITGLVSVGLALPAIIIGVLLPSRISEILAKLFFGVSLAFYLQGNFINISYGSGVLDGSKIDWSLYDKYAVVDTVVWIACILAPFAFDFLLRKLAEKNEKEKSKKNIDLSLTRKAIIGLSLVFIVMQLPALAVQLSSYRPNTQQGLQMSTEGMYDLSSEENVLVFVLDTFDEQYYTEFIEKHPEYCDKLDDFVHYDNNIATGGRTIVAMPAMLSGKPFIRDTTYSDYIEKVWSEDNVLSKLNEQGADVRVFSETEFFSTDTTEYVENFIIDEAKVKSYTILGKKLYKLSGFSFAPHLAKRYFQLNTSEFNEARESANYYTQNDPKFIKNYRKNGFSYTDDYSNAFRLYHLDGMHQPFTMGADGKKSDDATQDSTSKALFDVVIDMIDDLKENGLYDDSTIIITADHGELNKTECALFLLKEKGHKAEYTTSHAPVSGFDLPIYLCDCYGTRLDNQKYGMKLSDLTEDMKRERHFFMNTSGSSKVLIKEFVTTSYAGDRDNFIESRAYTFGDGDQPYTLGTKLSFELDATGNCYATEGFGNNTGFRTRLRGPKAVLRIPIDDLPEKGKLHTEFGLWVDKGIKRETEIFANGKSVYSGTIDRSNHQHTIAFDVPIDIVRDSDNILTIELTFPEVTDEKAENFSLTSLIIE